MPPIARPSSRSHSTRGNEVLGSSRQPLSAAYDFYSFKVLPRIGQWVAGDAASYRYLAESIRVHPGQAELKAMMKTAGFGHVDVHNLSAGVVALHVGIKC